MPLRLLLMILGYVGVCVAVFTLWPNTNEDVVVATQKTLQENEEAKAAEAAAAANTQTASTTENVTTGTVTGDGVAAPKDDMTLLEGDAPVDDGDLAQLVATADRLSLLEVWTKIEDCRLENCRSMNLSQVNLSFVPEEIRDLKRLNTLIVGDQIQNISALSDMRNIRLFSMNGADISSVKPLESLTGLRFLEMANAPVQDLSPLWNLGGLEHIDIAGTQVASLDPLKDLHALKYINARDSELLDLAGIENLFELEELLLSDTPVLDLSQLNNIDALRRLEVARTGLQALPDLAAHQDLELLDIADTAVSDLTPISQNTNLQVLNLSGSAVTDLSKISGLANLRELDLTNTQLSSLDVLNDLPLLETVFLSAVPPNSIGVLSALRERGVAIEQQRTEDRGNVAVVPDEDIETIRFLTGNAYPPYVGDDLPDGGFSTELITQAMAVTEGDPFAFEVVPDWGAHLSPLLSGGSFDLGFPWFKPDCSRRDLLGDASKWRCDNLRFSKPLHDIVVTAYAMNNNAVSISTPEDALGKRICRPTGYYTHDLEAMGLVEDAITRIAPDTPTECFEQMRAGRVDIVVLAADVSEAAIEELGMQNQVTEIVGLSSVQTLHAIGMKTDQRTRVLLRRLDIGLEALKGNGEFDNLMAKHLK
ncbi:MAG: transporter substrate-binding domain-containing protein [Pseudomonadota bacterium]